MANDRLSAHEWEEFTRCWIANLLPRVEGALYIVMAHQQWPLLCRLLDEAGAVWSDSIVWRKDHFALGRGDYQRMFELIWYGWRRGARHHWSGARNEPDVWEIPRINVARDHPTEKPVALVERALRNSTPREGTVLDCFLGSGTTLMACERLGLTCLGLELEPQYLATAIQRWQDETGLEAELEDSGD